MPSDVPDEDELDLGIDPQEPAVAMLSRDRSGGLPVPVPAPTASVAEARGEVSATQESEGEAAIANAAAVAPEEIDRRARLSERARKAWETRRSQRGDETDDADPPRAHIDEYDVDEVLAAFRRVSHGQEHWQRGELLRAVASHLGFERLGSHIDEVLRGHLRAAVRRGVFAADEGDAVHRETRALQDYSREELRERLFQLVGAGAGMDQEDLMRLTANYYGFRRLTDSAREALRSAVNSAIRQGLLIREDGRLRRS